MDFGSVDRHRHNYSRRSTSLSLYGTTADHRPPSIRAIAVIQAICASCHASRATGSAAVSLNAHCVENRATCECSLIGSVRDLEDFARKPIGCSTARMKQGNDDAKGDCSRPGGLSSEEALLGMHRNLLCGGLRKDNDCLMQRVCF